MNHLANVSHRRRFLLLFLTSSRFFLALCRRKVNNVWNLIIIFHPHIRAVLFWLSASMWLCAVVYYILLSSDLTQYFIYLTVLFFGGGGHTLRFLESVWLKLTFQKKSNILLRWLNVLPRWPILFRDNSVFYREDLAYFRDDWIFLPRGSNLCSRWMNILSKRPNFCLIQIGFFYQSGLIF